MQARSETNRAKLVARTPRYCRVAAVGVLAATAAIWSPARTAATTAYEGFGASTVRGSGKPIVRVTNLNDSGAGSLRAAVSAGNRTVVFDVAGDILLASDIYVRGAFVTIDGTTAPSPGITLRNRGLYIRGDRGAHDVILRGIRVRDAAGDGTLPASATRGGTITVTDTTRNQGPFAVGSSRTQFYLSVNNVYDTADVLLGGRSVPALASGQTSTASTTLTVPSGVTPRVYYVLARTDAGAEVPETKETNNGVAKLTTVY